MVSRAWKPGNLVAFQKRVTELPLAIGTEGEAATITVAEIAAEEMRDIIRHSGTGWDNREGRVDTGAMLDAVSSEGSRFGWINGFKEYFRIQDKGFVNLYKRSENEGKTWITGTGGPPGTTEGMRALDTARLVGKGQLHNLTVHLLSRVWRKLK